jgi:hypothetical protein
MLLRRAGAVCDVCVVVIKSGVQWMDDEGTAHSPFRNHLQLDLNVNFWKPKAYIMHVTVDGQNEPQLSLVVSLTLWNRGLSFGRLTHSAFSLSPD